jgi:hypothetical protein
VALVWGAGVARVWRWCGALVWRARGMAFLSYSPTNTVKICQKIFDTKCKLDFFHSKWL